MADEELREAICPICGKIDHAPSSTCPAKGAEPVGKDEFKRVFDRPPVTMDDLTDDEYLAKMDAEDAEAARVPLRIEALRAASRIVAGMYAGKTWPQDKNGKEVTAQAAVLDFAEELVPWLEKGER